MINQKIKPLCNMLLNLNKIENKHSSLVLHNGYIIIEKKLRKDDSYLNLSDSQRSNMTETCSIALHNRLIALDITSEKNDINASELQPIIKNKIISYYKNTGLSKESINCTIDNSLLQAKDIYKIFFMALLESSLGELLHKKQQEAMSKRNNPVFKYTPEILTEIKLQEQQWKLAYLQAMIKYRTNGLELAKKNIVAIGSSLIDRTGSYFNKETSVFFNFSYADFNGDIMNTIDNLHNNVECYNKFNKIVFTYVPGSIFKNIDDSFCLMMKLYDLLKNNGLIMIICGEDMHSNINSNYKFKQKILLHIGFKEENIKYLNEKYMYSEYTELLSLFTENNFIFKNDTNGLSLLIKK